MIIFFIIFFLSEKVLPGFLDKFQFCIPKNFIYHTCQDVSSAFDKSLKNNHTVATIQWVFSQFTSENVQLSYL